MLWDGIEDDWSLKHQISLQSLFGHRCHPQQQELMVTIMLLSCNGKIQNTMSLFSLLLRFTNWFTLLWWNNILLVNVTCMYIFHTFNCHRFFFSVTCSFYPRLSFENSNSRTPRTPDGPKCKVGSMFHENANSPQGLIHWISSWASSSTDGP